LTLEVIKVILMMLKFGLFNKIERTKERKVTAPAPDKGAFRFKNLNNIFGMNDVQIEKTEIEKVISYLAAFLEYDADYFKALIDYEIKRSIKIIIFFDNFSKIF